MLTRSYRKALTFVESQLSNDEILIILRFQGHTYHSKPLQAWSLLFAHQSDFRWMLVS